MAKLSLQNFLRLTARCWTRMRRGLFTPGGISESRLRSVLLEASEGPIISTNKLQKLASEHDALGLLTLGLNFSKLRARLVLREDSSVDAGSRKLFSQQELWSLRFP